MNLYDEQRLVVQQRSNLAEWEFDDRAFTRDSVELLADRGFVGISHSEEFDGAA